MKKDDIIRSQPKHIQNNWIEWEETMSVDELLPYYESIQNTGTCRALRKKILQESINTIQSSRRYCLLKVFWPFGGTKLSHQYLLPRCGLIFPKLIMPEKRFKLFPSKGRKRYKISEIMSWYNEDTLQDDDLLMFLSEVKGIKQRKYEIWLTFEPDRVEESREMFLEEDVIGHEIRTYWKTVENDLKVFAPAQAKHQMFSLASDPLPGTYGFIKEDTEEYVHGSGTYMSCFITVFY